MMKRSIDIVLSLVSIVVFSPVFIIVSILVAWNIGRPILFSQIRPGKNGKPFKMVKFRTMKNAVDDSGNPLSDADRLTDFGLYLRSTSLDELPELWNVVRGDMSLVGPRPLLMSYLPLYSEEQAHRHKLRPGITGWAQVNGRNSLSWDEKFKLDVWYVNHQTFWLDIKIILLTMKKVIRREGIEPYNHVIMPEFKGVDE